METNNRNEKKQHKIANTSNTSSPKQHKKKNTQRTVLTVVICVVTALIVLGSSIYLILYVAYGNLFGDGNIPIVDNTGNNTADIHNPPHIVTGDGIPPLDTGEDIPITPIGPNPDDTHEIYDDGVPTEYVGDIPIYKRNQIDKNVLNILIVGRDKDGTYGRADSSMVISYNMKTNQVKIVSLLRDCYVPININGGIWNKLGHSLSYGGMGLLINTVNDLLELDIQNYAVIDFSGLETVVNKIGGINVTFTQAEADLYNLWFGKQLYRAGTNRLNGDMALRHCRNRSIGSDFDRTRRQRDVLEAIYQKIFSLGLTKGMDVVTDILSLVKTNMPFNTCISMATDIFTGGGVSISTNHMPFEGTWEYGRVQPPGYSAPMSVEIIKIDQNRQKMREFLYN